MQGESNTGERLFLPALLALGAVYLLQTVSPLRLESDAVDYLGIAAAMADGRALPDLSLPLGYPVLIAMLDRAGLGWSFWFIMANCLFLGLGIWATWWIYSGYSIRVRMWIAVATLLLFPVVKSVAVPLPEAAFFAASLLSLAAASVAVSAERPKQLVLLAVSFVMAGLAISFRMIGVALIPALLWAAWSALTAAQGGRRRWPAARVIILLAFTAVFLILSRSATVLEYVSHPRYWYVLGGLSSPVGSRIYGMLIGFGELVTNVPFSRFHSLRPIFAAAGLVALLALALARPRPIRVGLADVYLVGYLAILAFWPYDSPRLWMPIAPLIVAHVVPTLHRIQKHRAGRFFVPVYAAWFCAAGILALAYTSRISLSGDNFARLYGSDGGMATPAHFAKDSTELHKYNSRAATILSRYGGGRSSR